LSFISILWICIFFFMGIIDSIVGYIIMASSFAGAASGTPAINIANSLLVLIFAFTWLSAGIAYLKNQDLVPLGNASIFMAAFMLVFAAFYALNGSWYLFANGISWAWAFSSITLASYEKLSSKVVGWTFIIEAIYTWWIPEAILLLGGQLP